MGYYSAKACDTNMSIDLNPFLPVETEGPTELVNG